MKRMVSKRRFECDPVFVAQPATACYCRSCLEQWHRIPKGRSLSIDEQNYILNLLKCWLHKELYQFEINHPVQ